MIDVIMPQMGESIVEGTLTKWLKKPGERVERDEPLFEISTDKVDTEIPSPIAGVLREVLVEEGQTVGINTVVGRIAEEGGAQAAGCGSGRTGYRAVSCRLPKLQPPRPMERRPRLSRHIRRIRSRLLGRNQAAAAGACPGTAGAGRARGSAAAGTPVSRRS